MISEFNVPDNRSNIKLCSANDCLKSHYDRSDIRYFQIHFEQIQNQLRELQDLAEKLQFEMKEFKHLAAK